MEILERLSYVMSSLTDSFDGWLRAQENVPVSELIAQFTLQISTSIQIAIHLLLSLFWSAISFLRISFVFLRWLWPYTRPLIIYVWEQYKNLSVRHKCYFFGSIALIWLLVIIWGTGVIQRTVRSLVKAVPLTCVILSSIALIHILRRFLGPKVLPYWLHLSMHLIPFIFSLASLSGQKEVQRLLHTTEINPTAPILPRSLSLPSRIYNSLLSSFSKSAEKEMSSPSSDSGDSSLPPSSPSSPSPSSEKVALNNSKILIWTKYYTLSLLIDSLSHLPILHSLLAHALPQSVLLVIFNVLLYNALTTHTTRRASSLPRLYSSSFLVQAFDCIASITDRFILRIRFSPISPMSPLPSRYLPLLQSAMSPSSASLLLRIAKFSTSSLVPLLFTLPFLITPNSLTKFAIWVLRDLYPLYSVLRAVENHQGTLLSHWLSYFLSRQLLMVVFALQGGYDGLFFLVVPFSVQLFLLAVAYLQLGGGLGGNFVILHILLPFWHRWESFYRSFGSSLSFLLFWKSSPQVILIEDEMEGEVVEEGNGEYEEGEAQDKIEESETQNEVEIVREEEETQEAREDIEKRGGIQNMATKIPTVRRKKSRIGVENVFIGTGSINDPVVLDEGENVASTSDVNGSTIAPLPATSLLSSPLASHPLPSSPPLAHEESKENIMKKKKSLSSSYEEPNLLSQLMSANVAPVEKKKSATKGASSASLLLTPVQNSSAKGNNGSASSLRTLEYPIGGLRRGSDLSLSGEKSVVGTLDTAAPPILSGLNSDNRRPETEAQNKENLQEKKKKKKKITSDSETEQVMRKAKKPSA